MRIVDLRLDIDGLILKDDESIEDFINGLRVNSIYPVIWDVLSEEFFDEIK